MGCVALFLGVLAVFSFYRNNVVNSKGEINEDALSVYSVPKDVLNAVTQAKSSGLPVLGIRADGPSYKIPVLMYHYVEYVQDRGDTIRISLNTPPSILDAQIKTLKDAGYVFLNASDVADILDGIVQAPDKSIVLTFDDGYRDFYTDVFPILAKYNVKAVEYVISGFIGEPNYLTKTQLLELTGSNLVEIGAHTIHHLALAGQNEATLTKEINDSKIQLEQILGVNVTSFAYPYGSFDLPAIQVAKKAGFRTAFSTVPGTEVGNYDRLFINRIRPGGATGSVLLKMITEK